VGESWRPSCTLLWAGFCNQINFAHQGVSWPQMGKEGTTMDSLGCSSILTMRLSSVTVFSTYLSGNHKPLLANHLHASIHPVLSYILIY
jgi:hypothetical protein